MHIDLEASKVNRPGNDVAKCFVACGVDGFFKAFIVMAKSRYLMGTTRPKQVGSLMTEYLSCEEFSCQQCEFGDVVRIHDANFLVVGVDGEDIVVSRSDCMAHFKQLDLARKLDERNERDQQAEKNRQHEQQKKLAVEEKRRSEERLEFVRCLEDRKRRMQRYFKLLRLFPELEVYRATVEQEHQVQIDLEKQSLDNLDVIVIDLQKANKSEMLNLISMRYEADKL